MQPVFRRLPYRFSAMRAHCGIWRNFSSAGRTCNEFSHVFLLKLSQQVERYYIRNRKISQVTCVFPVWIPWNAKKPRARHAGPEEEKERRAENKSLLIREKCRKSDIFSKKHSLIFLCYVSYNGQSSFFPSLFWVQDRFFFSQKDAALSKKIKKNFIFAVW